MAKKLHRTRVPRRTGRVRAGALEGIRRRAAPERTHRRRVDDVYELCRGDGLRLGRRDPRSGDVDRLSPNSDGLLDDTGAQESHDDQHETVHPSSVQESGVGRNTTRRGVSRTPIGRAREWEEERIIRQEAR